MPTDFQVFGNTLGYFSSSDKIQTAISDCYTKYGTAITKESICLKDNSELSCKTQTGTPLLYSELKFAKAEFDTKKTYGGLSDHYFTISAPPASFTKADLLRNILIIGNISSSPDSSFNTFHSSNMNVYKDMKTERDGLDIKMRELYNDEVSDNMTMQNSSIYMNVTLTVLATSVLYLLFAKL
jgi:hypothetical protein